MGKKYYIEDIKQPWLRRTVIVATLIGAFILIAILFLYEIIKAIVIAVIECVRENAPHIKEMVEVVRSTW